MWFLLLSHHPLLSPSPHLSSSLSSMVQLFCWQHLIICGDRSHRGMYYMEMSFVYLLFLGATLQGSDGSRHWVHRPTSKLGRTVWRIPPKHRGAYFSHIDAKIDLFLIWYSADNELQCEARFLSVLPASSTPSSFSMRRHGVEIRFRRSSELAEYKVFIYHQIKWPPLICLIFPLRHNISSHFLKHLSQAPPNPHYVTCYFSKALLYEFNSLVRRHTLTVCYYRGGCLSKPRLTAYGSCSFIAEWEAQPSCPATQEACQLWSCFSIR